VFAGWFWGVGGIGGVMCWLSVTGIFIVSYGLLVVVFLRNGGERMKFGVDI
jgi:hypothetical protein